MIVIVTSNVVPPIIKNKPPHSGKRAILPGKMIIAFKENLKTQTPLIIKIRNAAIPMCRCGWKTRK